MAFNFVAAIRGHFGVGVVQHLAEGLEETPSAISRGLDAGVPEIAGGLAAQVATDAQAQTLHEALTAGRFDGPQLGQMAGMLDGGPASMQLSERGQTLFQGLLGGRQGEVIATIAEQAGLRPGSVRSLLGLVTPIAMGVLGRRVHEDGLDASGLRALLVPPPLHASRHEVAEPGTTASEIPSRPADTPNRREVAEPGTTASEIPSRPADIPDRRRGIPVPRIEPVAVRRQAPVGRWLLPAGLALLLVLGWSLLRGQRNEGTEQLPVARTSPDAVETRTPQERSTSERADALARTDPEGQTPVGRNRPTEDGLPPEEAGTGGSEPASPEQSELTLPDGSSLRAAPGSGLALLAGSLAKASEQGTGGGGVPRGLETERFAFPELSFQDGSSHLDAEARATVTELARLLEAYPDTRLRIEGHANRDGDGDPLAVSQSRADAVRVGLELQGIAGSRLEAVGHGASDPIGPANDAEARRRNARTDLILLGNRGR